MKTADGIVLETKEGEIFTSEQLLIATGRKLDIEELNLDKAQVRHSSKAIEVDNYLRTSQKNIYAVGDCNGYAQLSHAAMHQAMIAVFNIMLPRGLKKNFRKFPVPWTVVTEPQVSCVGLSEKQLVAQGIDFEVIEVRYEDYGAAIAENLDEGFVKVFASKWGTIYGVSLLGYGSGEMINEWAMAIQNNRKLYHIMMQQHSFPTMGFLSKRVAETWMMKRLKSPWIRKIVTALWRF